MLVKIFGYIRLQFLLSSVCLVCKRVYRLIESTSVLWSDVDFDFCLHLNKTALSRILSHSRHIHTLLLSCCTLDATVPEIDNVFSKASFTNLIWITLSRAPIATLCFLLEAKHLVIIDVSECTNLLDDDLCVLKTCEKLKQLYVSFTKIQPNTLQAVCYNEPLVVFDACNIPLDMEKCRSILDNTIGHIV